VLRVLNRLADDIAVDLGALSLSGSSAAPAARAALAGTLAALTALALRLDNPWWAAISGIAVVQANAPATLGSSIDRAIGTTIGAAAGYLASVVAANHLAFFLFIASCSGVVIYAHQRSEHRYAVLLSGVTTVLVAFGSLASPGVALHLAVYRALEIYVGVIAACVVDFAFSEPALAPAAAASRSAVWSRPFDREFASIAVTGGMAIALIPLIWDTLNLPGLDQTPITAFVILTATPGVSSWKALTRAAGCLLGGLYGLAAMHVVGDTFLPWLIALAVGLFIAAHVQHQRGEAAYVGAQAAMAIVLAMVQGKGPSPDILPAIDRLTGILGGVIVVSICQPLLLPLVRRAIQSLVLGAGRGVP
jgi:uncharacterized membrane protein YccC